LTQFRRFLKGYMSLRTSSPSAHAASVAAASQFNYSFYSAPQVFTYPCR
jgi:hypothetical protein